MKEIDYLILILHYEEDYYYTKFKEALELTCYANIPPNCKKIYYTGNSSNIKFENDTLYLPIKESIQNITEKTILAFDYAINNFNFKWLVRPNISTYLNLNVLNDYKIESENYYGGHVAEYLDNLKFCAGSCYILSCDLITKLVDNKDMVDYSLIDDVAIAKYLSQLGIDCKDMENFRAKGRDFNPINFSYRLKGQNRKSDIECIYKLHEAKRRHYNEQ